MRRVSLGAWRYYNHVSVSKSRKEKLVVINADDFGFSTGVTEGILRAHLEGVVTSTTIMANMPAAEEAVARLDEAPELGVGVHLNVSQGRPLSRTGEALAEGDGVMRRSAVGVVLACIRRPGLIDAVEAEFDAQIRWTLDHGIRPTHLDSHRHTHGWPAVFARVVKLARRYDIRFIRRLREVLTGRRRAGSPLRQLVVSRALALVGAAGGNIAPELTRAGGTMGISRGGCIDADWLIRAARSVRPGVTEFITHPGLPDGLDPAYTRLIESRRGEMEALCDPRVRRAFERNGIRLVHYGQL